MTRAIGLWVFVAIGLAGVALDLLSRRGRISGPNLTQVVDRLQASIGGQLALFVGWAFAGWHFFVR